VDAKKRVKKAIISPGVRGEKKRRSAVPRGKGGEQKIPHCAKLTRNEKKKKKTNNP